jgi:hypothetical protein
VAPKDETLLNLDDVNAMVRNEVRFSLSRVAARVIYQRLARMTNAYWNEVQHGSMPLYQPTYLTHDQIDSLVNTIVGMLERNDDHNDDHKTAEKEADATRRFARGAFAEKAEIDKGHVNGPPSPEVLVREVIRKASDKNSDLLAQFLAANARGATE